LDQPLWPDGRRAAVSLTFDNLGEAADLEGGRWPADAPVGSHYSVVRVLPRLLDLLRDSGLAGTFFIEGWNTEVYPDAIRRIAVAGHEVGFHGWRHEQWGALAPEREAETLARGRRAFADLGVELRGFRPAGGRLTPATVGLLREAGFTYCSPAGASAAVVDGVAVLPFRWEAIDAYYYFKPFAALRELRGDAAEPLPPERLIHALGAFIDAAVASGGFLALLFHAFLEDEEPRFAAMRQVVRTLAARRDVWCAPCHAVADWVRGHAGSFPTDAALDETSWARPPAR
jgi:peptidoglycan/xylan/chitin deacetylase (PgdA/CDA1 family)